MGVCSRREAETWITQRRITLNGKIVEIFATSINPDRDEIRVDGKLVVQKGQRSTSAPLVYWLFHKPAGFVVTQAGANSIFNLPKLKKLPFKVKAAINLTKYAEGLCILTNDEILLNECQKQTGQSQLIALMIDRRLSVEEMTRIFATKSTTRPVVKVTYHHKAKIGASTGYWYYLAGQIPDLKKTLDQKVRAGEVQIYKYVVLEWGHLKMPEGLAQGNYIQLSASDIHRLKKLVGSKSETKAENLK